MPQQELDLLSSVMGAPCLIHSPAVCVLPFPVDQYSDLANKSRNLGLMINTTWSSNFTVLLRELRNSIWALNKTKAQVEIWSPFSIVGRWISSTWSDVKGWVAMGGLFVLLLIGFIMVRLS